MGLVSSGAEEDRAHQRLATATDRLDARRGDDALAVKAARDAAHEAARAAVVVMNSVDYRTVDDDLAEWERVSTGALHDDVVSGKEKSRDALVRARSVTEADVLSSAVRNVDTSAATVLVAVRVEVVVGDEAPTEKFMRLEALMRRTDQGWKLEGLSQVAYR